MARFQEAVVLAGLVGTVAGMLVSFRVIATTLQPPTLRLVLGLGVGLFVTIVGFLLGAAYSWIASLFDGPSKS